MNESENDRDTGFGLYLNSLRQGLKLSLRDVESQSNKKVSNAYLSQLENGKIQKPSPHILYSLSSIYGVPYETLMRRAGYIAPDQPRGDKEKHGNAATSSIENLTNEEERELLRYLSYIRTNR